MYFNFRMTILATALLSLVICGCNTPQSATRSTAASRPHERLPNRVEPAPGPFDYYLLNLSWSPEFCYSHPGSPECASHPGFVVHGLWPQKNDGTYPQACSNAPGPVNPQSLTGLFPTASLVEHEWHTHGTCSGLSPDDYFGIVRKAVDQVRIPAGLKNVQHPSMMAPSFLLSQFSSANKGFPPDSFALSCGHNYLTAIEICFAKDLSPISCPNVRTCRASAVKITPQQ